MPLQRIGVMEDRARQMAVLDIHVLESVPVLLLQKLIKKRLLEVYSFNIEQCYEAIVITFGQDGMEHVSALVIDIYLLMNNILWRPCLRHQIQRNVLESKVPSYIQRCSSQLISLDNELENIILTLNNSFIVTIIILIKARIESLHDFSQLTGIDLCKDTFTAHKHVFP